MRSRTEILRSAALCSRRRRAEYRTRIIELLGGKCVECGFTDARGLCIDHINSDGWADRQHRSGNYYKKILDKILAGATGYQLLCGTHNQIKFHEKQEFADRKYTGEPPAKRAPWRHGTDTGYRHCRCVECRFAHAKYQRERRMRLQGATLEVA